MVVATTRLAANLEVHGQPALGCPGDHRWSKPGAGAKEAGRGVTRRSVCGGEEAKSVEAWDSPS